MKKKINGSREKKANTSDIKTDSKASIIKIL